MAKRNSTCKLCYVQNWNFRSFCSINSRCQFIVIVKCVRVQGMDKNIDADTTEMQGIFPCQIKQSQNKRFFEIYSNFLVQNIIYFLPAFGYFYCRSPFLLLVFILLFSLRFYCFLFYALVPNPVQLRGIIWVNCNNCDMKNATKWNRRQKKKK